MADHRKCWESSAWDNGREKTGARPYSTVPVVTHKRQRRLVIKSGSQRHVLDSRNVFVCAHACLQSSPVLMSVQSAVYKRIKRIERIQTRQAQVKASPPLPAKHLPLWLTCNCCRLRHGLTKASHSHARHLLLQSALLGRCTRVVRQLLQCVGVSPRIPRHGWRQLS